MLTLVAGLVTSLAFEADARRERDNVLRLSAIQEMEDLLNEAEALWPVDPKHIEEYEEWIEDAQLLLTTLPEHRSRRELLGAGADGELSEEKRRWWNNQLSKLIEQLEELADESEGLLGTRISPEHGWGIHRRLGEAELLRDGFELDGEFQARWDEALSMIRADYPELELTPQMGLVPIGRDPDSRMWEFWHVMSGDEPIRCADGTLAMTEDSGVVLVLLPGGRFWMGSQTEDSEAPNYVMGYIRPYERPAHEVPISPFFMSKYEMTQGQWKRLAGSNPSVHGPEGFWYKGFNYDGSEPSLLLPVEQVSWRDCMRELRRAGLELPTEAQWEYACRAGTDTAWWTGPEEKSMQDAANLADDYMRGHGYPSWPMVQPWLDDGYTVGAPVDTLRANPFALHHVHGNMWEWCLDGFDQRFYGKDEAKVLDPISSFDENVKLRVARGGNCFYHPDFARSAMREAKGPDAAQLYTGVRPSLRIRR